MKPLLIHILLVALAACTVTAAHAQISVRSSLSDDREVAPGTPYEGTILVRNETDATQQAKIYQTDYLFYHDGRNEYGAPGSTARSNAGWITFTPALLTLPPGETLPVTYEVAVPETGADGTPLEGTYWSMLMVEGIAAGSPESTLPGTPEQPQYAVRQVMRYGVQVATHLEGTGRRRVAFSDTELVVDERGANVLHVSLENVGSRMIRPEVWAELFDEAGSSLGRRPGTQTRIYPGTSVRQRIDLGALAPGTYRALVVVDAGDEDIYGAEYTLQF